MGQKSCLDVTLVDIHEFTWSYFSVRNSTVTQQNWPIFKIVDQCNEKYLINENNVQAKNMCSTIRGKAPKRWHYTFNISLQVAVAQYNN